MKQNDIYIVFIKLKISYFCIIYLVNKINVKINMQERDLKTIKFMKRF